MISLQSRTIPQSSNCSFPKDLFILDEFKDLVNGQAALLGITDRFRPRLYTHADYIIVKLYALARRISTHIAAESLNQYITNFFKREYGIKPQKFSDQKRQRRYVPHQTDVDKYFRRLTETEVHNLFGNINLTLCRKIAKHFGTSQKWRILIDNTEYPYYGQTSTSYEQKTFKPHMGTKTVRMFQGHVVHCQNMTLFTDFYLLQKGKCRWLPIPRSSDWIKWNKFNLSYGLMDREFYRVQLIKKLKDRNIPIIMPSKKYAHVKRRIKNYLLKKETLVSEYLFKQKSGAKPWQTSVKLFIVIVGHDNQAAWKIREKFWKGTLSFEEALKQLAAFFTTLQPWENHRSWARWLIKTYKIRWNQETGFSSLNKIHAQFRYRFPVVQLAELYLRAMIHNGWQFFRNQGLRSGFHHQDLTLFWYQMNVVNQLETTILDMSLKRNNLDKKEKGGYN